MDSMLSVLAAEGLGDWIGVWEEGAVRASVQIVGREGALSFSHKTFTHGEKWQIILLHFPSV